MEDAVMDDPDWAATPLLRSLKDKAHRQLGTSGSGNHFVELGELEDLRLQLLALGLPLLAVRLRLLLLRGQLLLEALPLLPLGLELELLLRELGLDVERQGARRRDGDEDLRNRHLDQIRRLHVGDQAGLRAAHCGQPDRALESGDLGRRHSAGSDDPGRGQAADLRGADPDRRGCDVRD